MIEKTGRKAALVVSTGLLAVAEAAATYAKIYTVVGDLCQEAGNSPGLLRFVNKAVVEIAIASEFDQDVGAAKAGAKVAVRKALGPETAEGANSDQDQAQA